ncbi:MAG: hypothetical protein EBS73_06750 [Betaproteobacteria bacterium]|nr:hypothetical protein [Betaproteobacteria bacterium]
MKPMATKSSVKRWGLSWEFQAVSLALHASLDRQVQATAGLPEQLHRARLQVMQGIGPQDADSSRVLREMAAGALRRWGLLRQLQALMSERESATETLSLGDCLLRLSLSWMIEQPVKTAMIVDQAVECAKRIAPKSAHYTNALLRRFGRERESLMARALASEEAIWNVPGWWLGVLRKAYPDDWQRVLKAAAQPAPVSLRVNRRRVSQEDLAVSLAERGYPAKCFAPAPGKVGGDFLARQVQAEQAPALKLYTRDALHLHPATDPKHLPGFLEGLFTVQDLAAQQAAWLIDLRWRRQEDALSQHQAQQFAMLCRLWPLLKRGGLLLFVTCSIFPQEGELPVRDFLAQHQDAQLEPLKGLSPLLPSCDESLQHDGFYFARLRKRRP